MYKAVIKLKKEQLACLIQFAHDEGLEMSFYREEEETPVQEPEKKQEPLHPELPFEMVVGGVYEMRNGGIENIVNNERHPLLPFEGRSGRYYTERGTLYKTGISPFDLIRRIR